MVHPENVKSRLNLLSGGFFTFRRFFCILRVNFLRFARQATKVYDLVMLTPEKNRNLTRRCLNFAALESVLEKYLARIETSAYEENIQEGMEQEEFGMTPV